MIKIPPDELVTLEDGYIYYNPYPYGGVLSEEALREIADQLHNLNLKHHQQLELYFKDHA